MCDVCLCIYEQNAGCWTKYHHPYCSLLYYHPSHHHHQQQQYQNLLQLPQPLSPIYYDPAVFAFRSLASSSSSSNSNSNSSSSSLSPCLSPQPPPLRPPASFNSSAAGYTSPPPSSTTTWSLLPHNRRLCYRFKFYKRINKRYVLFVFFSSVASLTLEPQ